jgi:hypothetical protein
MTSSIKSAFAPMRATRTASPSAAPPSSPERLPKKPQPSKTGQPSAKDEVALDVTFWIEVVEKPLKEAPFWAYVGNPREIDTFGRRIVAVLNTSHWPATAAVERKDWRAIKWMASLAILERVGLQYHPILSAVRFRLCQLALCRPKAHERESILWAGYRLKDSSFLAGLESIPLTVGTLQQFNKLTVSVNAGKLEQWRRTHKTKQTVTVPLSDVVG